MRQFLLKDDDDDDDKEATEGRALDRNSWI